MLSVLWVKTLNMKGLMSVFKALMQCVDMGGRRVWQHTGQFAISICVNTAECCTVWD